MFSKAIVTSARFLKMPVDSQSLYFQLSMAADDDGVVEAWSVLKTTGSAEDNLRVLSTKGLIKILNEDLVSYILDWNEHNLVRSDRLVPSQYRELLVQVVTDVELVTPTQRADRLGRPWDNHGTAQGRVGEGRLNTSDLRSRVISYEKEIPEREERPRSATKYPNAPTVFGWFPDPEPSWSLNTTELKHAELLHKRGEAKVKSILIFVKKYNEWDYFPQVTKPSDLERKWEDIIKWGEKNGV